MITGSFTAYSVAIFAALAITVASSNFPSTVMPSFLEMAY